MIQNLIDTFSIYPIQVIAILSFLPILLMMLYDYRYNKKHELEKRIQGYLDKDKDEKMIDRAVKTANNYLGEKGDKIQLKLERSNIHFKKEEYLTLMILGVIGGAAVGVVMFPFGGVFKAVFSFIHSPYVQLFFARILAGVAFGALGYIVPEVWIKYLIYDRKRLLDEQIEEALLQLADALRSGIGINTAIRIAADELRYPMKDEFTVASQEISTNKPFNDVLNDLILRVDLKDFTMAMNAIQIQNETGASLEPLLREIVKTISDRKILKKEVQKAITNSKGTGMILMIAPLLFSIVFSSMNAEAYSQMFKSPLGFGMVVVGIVSYVIGSGIIIKIIRDVSKLS